MSECVRCGPGQVCSSCVVMDSPVPVSGGDRDRIEQRGVYVARADLDLAIRALRGNFDHYPEIGRLRAALNERKEA